MSERVALVTGAGRGIGQGIALALADRGWSIVVNYRGNAETATATANLIRERNCRALVVQADVAKNADRERLLAETLATFGHVHLLVNNAGMAPRQRTDILKTTLASYDEVMDVNLKGPFFLTQMVARHMVEVTEQGVVENAMIVNIGSISGYTSSTNRGEYCISKAGMGMMTALFADRLAPYGINVYEVRPGVTRTDMTSKVAERYDQLIAEGLTPIRRWGEPEDVALAVAAIAEGSFPFSTGEVINVDGGFHLRRL